MRRLLPLFAALFAVGCAEKDTTAPPAPNLDPLESPTALTKVTLTGSAEYGAKIHISGGKAAVDTSADAFTARFRAEVELNADQSNTLSVTATDAAGNVSPAATLELSQQTGYGIPKEISLKLYKNQETTELPDPAQVQVGDSVRIEAKVLDGKGNILDLPLSIQTDATGALIEGTTLTNLQRAGTFTLVISAKDTNVFASKKLEIVPGAPVKMTLTPGTPTAAAGQLVPLIVSVQDAAGNEIVDAPITFSVSPSVAATFTLPNTTPAQTKEQGILGSTRQFVVYDLSAASSTGGDFTITATSGTLSANTTVNVHAGAGQRFSTLEWLPSGTGTTKTISAGTDAQYSYQVVDLYGNPSSTHSTAFTSAPGAVIVDDGVSGQGTMTGLTAVGSFSVSFYIAGAGLKGSLQLNVGTGPVATVTAATSAQLVAPQSDVKVFAQVRDPYGNRILCTTATAADIAWAATSNGGGSASPTGTGCFNGAFQATFKFTTEDTWAVDAPYNPAGTPSGVKDTVFITVLGFDNTPPTVSITNVFRNGAPCTLSGTPPACTVRPGDFMEFDVVANDNKSLSEIDYTAFFSTVGTTGSLQTRSVLVPQNATLPLTQSFSFRIPNGTFLEDVPLTALAVDGAGNRATSSALMLHVSFTTYKNRNAQLVVRDLGGGIVNGPEDVAIAPTGEVFIANANQGNVLKLAAGSNIPQVYASTTALQGFSPEFLLLDPAGNLYLTDTGGSPTVKQITPNAAAVNDYVTYTNGANLHGFAQTAAVPAKAMVTVGTLLDGDTLTIGSTVYELNLFGACNSVTATCIAVPTGSTSSQIASLLEGCINAGTSCTVNGATAAAHPSVMAKVNPAGSNSVILAANTAGAAGNNIALTTASCPRINFNGAGNTCPPPVSSLTEGHDATFFVGQEGGGGGSFSVIYRFPFSFTAPFPKTNANNEGAFDTFFNGVPHEHWGLAVKDLTTPTSRNGRDLAFYFPDFTIGSDRLRGVRFQDTQQTTLFNSAGNGTRPGCTDCIRGTNDPATPLVQFNRLRDVVAEPIATLTPMVAANGCLLVSDSGNGNIYSVDTRDPLTADPLVSLVASGLASPRGMEFGPNGDLYVAIRNANAVVKISPSSDPSDCF